MFNYVPVMRWHGYATLTFSILALLALSSLELTVTATMTSSDRSLWPRILLLGDSITQAAFSYEGGWGSMLSDSLHRRCDFVARGFLGYNTRLWRTVCRELPLKSLEGELALLFLGANDASAANELEFVPLEEYKENLADIVTYLKDQCGIPQVLLIAPPPIDVSVFSPDLAADGKTEELTAQYAAACVEAATNLQVPVLDTHSLFLEQPNWRSLLLDGLHLNRNGSELLHSLLLPEVRTLIESAMPSSMGSFDLILPDTYKTSNVYPSLEIAQWVQDHPFIEGTNRAGSKQGTARSAAGSLKK